MSAEYRSVHRGDRICLEEAGEVLNYTITDPAGIHARPAGNLKKIADGYDCEITVFAHGKRASAGSLIGLMNLGVREGDTLVVTAKGRDAQEAIREVEAYLRRSM